MATLYFIPQMPTAGRYTQWWITEFTKKFEKYYDVVILGEDIIRDMELRRDDFSEFSNVDQAILLEIAQIEDYLNIKESIDDILFCTDLSFPGIFSNVLYTKSFIGKKFIFCHATSKNKFDYFSDMRSSKFKVETGHSMLFDKVFVGSYYHKDKLGWDNVEVVRLPKPPYDIISNQVLHKSYDIVSVSRPNKQKVQIKLEKKVEGLVGSKIIRKTFSDPIEYSTFLSQAKILFISSLEDTFNYTIMDALRCNCIPVAPRRLCFPEILPDEYLYNDAIEAFRVCKKILRGELGIPRMLCHNEVENFFPNLVEKMK